MTSSSRRPIVDLRDEDRFYLTDNFLEQYKGKQPKWGPLGYVTYKRTYARPIHEENRTEEFWETLKRVVNGVYTMQKYHCNRLNLPWNSNKAQKSAQTMFDLMWNMKFLPPGRGLWMMGTEHVFKLGSAALNNCSMVSTKDIKHNFSEPFCTLADFSMLGVGVGFDTKGAGTLKLKHPKLDEANTFVVEDSREGWVELVRTILESYTGKEKLPVSVDYSNIRPAGAPIKTFGGIASGSKPLEELVNDLNKELQKYIDKEVTSELIVDIANLIGRCVVSGNVRRSAQISFGELNDESFLNLKNPEINKEKLYHHRWASNNSIYVNPGDDYSEVAKLTAMNGEPGYMWLENARQYGRMNEFSDDSRVEGTNPCGEISLENKELCNLVEVFSTNHDSFEEFQKTLKFAYLYAKSVTLIPTHDAKTNNVMLRNRRIGTSVSGIIQAMNKLGTREFLTWCDKGYEFLKELDQKYSEWLCIPNSKRLTTCKPSGSVSLLPGVTSGIHHPHSKHYIRRIRFQSNSELLGRLKKAGYKIEKDKYSANTSVVEFPIEEEYFSKGKNDVSMWEQLELTAQMQQYWSDNAVSVTVTFNKEEANQIKDALELYETRLKTVSFLPLSDHGYEQAPYEEITEEQYKKMSSKLKPIEFENVLESEGHKHRYCDSDKCEI